MTMLKTQIAGLLLAASFFCASCGDDPKPGPGPNSGSKTNDVEKAEAPAGPILDAIREGDSWRITLTLPAELPPGFVAKEAVLESAKGEELARQAWKGDHSTFSLKTQGQVSGVVLGSDGQRLQETLELP